MMHNFQFVPRSEYLPAKKELEKLINAVQDEVRDDFTFSFTYVGSTHRKLITKDLKGMVLCQDLVQIKMRGFTS